MKKCTDCTIDNIGLHLTTKSFAKFISKRGFLSNNNAMPNSQISQKNADLGKKPPVLLIFGA